jgi:hypothetical protein
MKIAKLLSLTTSSKIEVWQCIQNELKSIELAQSADYLASARLAMVVSTP